jgi:hypothetical protein
MNLNTLRTPLAGLVLVSSLAFPLALAQTAQPLPTQQQPVVPEKSPPGDIPDTQLFVPFQSPAGFTIEIPEGWAKTDNGTTVTFADKYNLVDITVSDAAAAPTAQSVESDMIPTLLNANRAVEISKTSDVTLPGGAAVRIDYASNSDPNPVTNKQVRLEDNRYVFFKGGKLVTVTFSAPYGADNVDAWKQMAESFRWQ